MPVLFELVVEVVPSLSEVASRALFAAGAPGLEERTSGRKARLVVWSERREEIVRWAGAARRELGETGVKLSIRRADDDWSTRWTRYLAPVKLGSKFLVCPVGSSPQEPGRRREILIVPRLAFGLGDHPTTRLAAREVERWARAEPGGELLDVGCGTGILCMLAVLSGAQRALGLDLDDVAVQNARENAVLNGLAQRCTFRRRNARALRMRFDFAVANIDEATLLDVASDLRRLAPRLALTGLLESQTTRVAAVYARLGFGVQRITRERGWALVALAQRIHRKAGRGKGGWG